MEKRHVRTIKEHGGITAKANHTIEADGSWNSLATMTLWWQTHSPPPQKKKKKKNIQKNHLVQPGRKDTQPN